MILRSSLFLFTWVPAVCAVAQDTLRVRGTVFSAEDSGPNSPLIGARVGWLQGPATVTDTAGAFALPPPATWPATLVASTFSAADTLVLDALPASPLHIVLGASVQLKTTEVVARQSSTFLSTRTLQATEALGPRELKRAACCDLSESFETNATVDVSFSDAISGTKTIRMLGLDGKYAQISVENIPFIRGLSSSYGLTLVPGPWINSINVSKGVGTAVNGPNAMTGQIELCLLSPLDADRLFTNLYVNSQGRTELNVNTAQRTGAHSANVLMVQGNLFQRELDQNNDGFMDQPLTKRFNVMDRWMAQTDKRTTQAAVRYVTDQRDGGQVTTPGTEASGFPRYGVNIHNELVDAFAKNGWIMGPLGRTSIGLIAAGRRHTADAVFGDRHYAGEQRSAYLSAVYQQVLRNNDQVKAGLTFQFDDYNETYVVNAPIYRPGTAPVLDLGRTERMPGAFAEYTRSRKGLTLVGGLRADANSYYGNVLSPRLHVKYDIGPLTTIRFSSGYAFRAANPLVENASALASSRVVSVEGPLGLERAWNNGLSFLHKFKWLGKKWAFGVDAYRTDLTAQVVADLDRSPQQLVLYMGKGPSFGNSVLVDLQVSLTRQLDAKASYRWYDVRTTYDGVLRERPFVPTHRGMASVGYVSHNEHWRTDLTLNVFGTSRLPNTASDPEAYRLPERAPAYATLNAQLTRVLGAWEVYLGGENLTSTLQSRQIIAPEDPFGPYFDASMIWGPTNTAMVYGGVRFTLKKKTAPNTEHP